MSVVGAVLEAIAWVAAWTLIYTVIGLAAFIWIDNAPYRFPRWMSPFERAFRAFAKAIGAIFDLQLRAVRGFTHLIGSASQAAPRRRRHGARR